jgi:hypothetical protein
MIAASKIMVMMLREYYPLPAWGGRQQQQRQRWLGSEFQCEAAVFSPENDPSRID